MRRPEGLKVTYRRMKFDFEQGFPRYWFAGSPFKSLFWSQLSTAFDPGERFFIDSARALKGHVDDPALVDELMEFCKQEGHHTAQHLKFDRVNSEMGLDMDRCRNRYAWILNRVRKNADPLEMLAVTTALEHFTAGLAHEYFTRPELSAGGDPRVVALWAWHAVEEAEHKATCFDVYRKAGGGEFTRLTTIGPAWFIIISISVWNTLWLLRKDKKLGNVKDVLGGFWYLFGWKGFFTSMIPTFLAYFSPSFHPWKEDNSAQIARWQAENLRYIQNQDELGIVAAE